MSLVKSMTKIAVTLAAGWAMAMPAAAATAADPPATVTIAAGQLACPSASGCWQIGVDVTHANLLRGVAGHRTSVLAPRPQGLAANTLISLSGLTCLSATDCWVVGSAVGNYSAHWNGHSWRPIPLPTPAGEGAELKGVSCVTASSCFAVGVVYRAGETLVAEALHWNGKRWLLTAVSSDASHKGKNAELTAVSCTAGGCWAVGSWNSGYGKPWTDSTAAYRYGAGHWSEVAVPRDVENQAPSIACVSTTECWIAGALVPPGSPGTANSMLLWNGHRWAAVTVPSPVALRTIHTSHRSGWSGNVLEDVACSTSTDCWAVGDVYSQAAGGWRRPQTLHWDGRNWKVVTPPRSGQAGDNYLRTVACVPHGRCWLAGESFTTDMTSQQLSLSHWSGTHWAN